MPALARELAWLSLSGAMSGESNLVMLLIVGGGAGAGTPTPPFISKESPVVGGFAADVGAAAAGVDDAGFSNDVGGLNSPENEVTPFRKVAWRVVLQRRLEKCPVNVSYVSTYDNAEGAD